MIRLIADSTCDLSKEIIEEYNIKIISTKLLIDGKKLNDYDFHGEVLANFYENIDDIKDVPGYEAPGSEEYVTAIEEGVFNGITEFIIFIPSSQQITEYEKIADDAVTTFMENNRIEGIKIHVVNTFKVSQGFGYTLLKAARMAKSGSSYEEIVDFCENNKSKVKDFMAVPDVDFLYKTGNVTKAGANATKALGITPVLKLGAHGKAKLANKVVGNNKVAQCFASEFSHNADIEVCDFVIIGYSTDKERALEAREALFKETHFNGDIYIMQVRPAFGAHIGKSAVCLYFMGKQKSLALFSIFRFR